MDFTGVAGRQGRTDLPKQIVALSSSLTRKAHESSIGVKGAKIFNLLSDEIRDLDSKNVDTFKSALDSFFSFIPGQPTTTAGNGRTAKTNSLLHQIPITLLNKCPFNL